MAQTKTVEKHPPVIRETSDLLKPGKRGRTFSLSVENLAQFLLLQAGEEVGRFDLDKVGAELTGSRPPRGDGFYLDLHIPEAS